MVSVNQIVASGDKSSLARVAKQHNDHAGQWFQSTAAIDRGIPQPYAPSATDGSASPEAAAFIGGRGDAT
jgi:hypothetical protein